MNVPKKPAARGLYWYVMYKGEGVRGMTVEQISEESGTPVSSVYEHAESVGLWIERQKATVRPMSDLHAPEQRPRSSEQL